ncbi:MAG: hypothetical protein H0U53_02875, partial [Actinobacteria bacterium]|nr:hypothetical protein [Actinomycetota bacterium]
MDTPPIFENTLRTMKELGVPDRILEQIRSGTDIDSTTDVYAFGASDLNGDGIREIIEWRVTYAFSVGTGGQNETTGVEERFATVLTLRSGDDGKKLWRRSYDDFVIPVDTIVADGRKGILTIGGLLSMLGTSGERNLDFESLKGTNGKRFWSRSFTSIESDDVLTHISEDAPISIGLARALPGKPMDVVISLATQVSTLFTTTVAARVVVVDGKDGEPIAHPRLDVSLGWLPFSNPVGDLDGDGLDDYVVANDPGVDLGGPQEAPSVGGTIYARKGTDGSEIWTTSGLELHDFGWAGGLPNVVGGTAGEVALITPNDPQWRDFAVYLFDGTTGFLRWKKLGLGVMALGDVDRDGRIDLAMGDASISFKRHEAVFTSSVFAGSGRKIYEQKHHW